jgi:hypothetical protein
VHAALSAQVGDEIQLPVAIQVAPTLRRRDAACDGRRIRVGASA